MSTQQYQDTATLHEYWGNLLVGRKFVKHLDEGFDTLKVRFSFLNIWKDLEKGQK